MIFPLIKLTHESGKEILADAAMIFAAFRRDDDQVTYVVTNGSALVPVKEPPDEVMKLKEEKMKEKQDG